jgi:hypothetical protein
VANPLLEQFGEVVLDKITRDMYPGTTQMDMLEAIATPRMRALFAHRRSSSPLDAGAGGVRTSDRFLTRGRDHCEPSTVSARYTHRDGARRKGKLQTITGRSGGAPSF